jgi:hypothetical protein
MNATRSLRDLPLWRLLVALHDTELAAGADSESARLLAKLIRERLRGEEDRNEAQEELHAS